LRLRHKATSDLQSWTGGGGQVFQIFGPESSWNAREPKSGLWRGTDSNYLCMYVYRQCLIIRLSADVRWGGGGGEIRNAIHQCTDCLWGKTGVCYSRSVLL